MKKSVSSNYSAGLIFLCFLFASSNSQADLIIYNQSEDELSVAMIYEHFWRWGEPPTWPAKGWFQIGSRSCETIYYGGISGFLSIYKKKANGEASPTQFQTQPGSSIQGTSAMPLVDKYVCLPDGPIGDRYRDKLIDYKTCREDEVKQKLNVAFQVMNNTNFT